MGDGSSAVWFGAAGFEVLDVAVGDAELVVEVQTTANVVGCELCGTRARPKDRRWASASVQEAVALDMSDSVPQLPIAVYLGVHTLPPPSCLSYNVLDMDSQTVAAGLRQPITSRREARVSLSRGRYPTIRHWAGPVWYCAGSARPVASFSVAVGGSRG